MLLVHDHLFAKNGIAAPATHPLRQAVERHKTRLKAEFVKARVRRGCATVEQLKAAVSREKKEKNKSIQNTTDHYPRWIRINNLCTSLEEQLGSTFLSYRRVDSLAQLAQEEDDENGPCLYIDQHIPDLVAVAPSGVDFSSSTAYKNGEIILQDKASCFPAYLLVGDAGANGQTWQGDIVDGCAAPGNKTTHLASMLYKQQPNDKKRKIFSMDASQTRSKTLQKMVSLAGADDIVTILPGQDFLAVDPCDTRFADVTGLLLDPSCSGSGIVGRDDVPVLTLPAAATTKIQPTGKKRKRKHDNDYNSEENKKSPRNDTNTTDENDLPTSSDPERLVKLSNLQARIVEHALSFPAATRVTYSTCSIHSVENEGVVSRILNSDVAKRRGWRLLRRDEQCAGLQAWKYRGIREEAGSENSSALSLSDSDLDACIRCWPGEEGLGGFFVAGFVRDQEGNGEDQDEEEEEEWEGFSD